MGVSVPKPSKLKTHPSKLRNQVSDNCPEVQCPFVQYSGPHDPTPQKITFGELRNQGVTEILIYCRDHRCSHHTEANADGWADDVRLSDTCARCSIHAANCSPC